ncbi:putative urea active transporter protein [Seiridium cardinale]|uniref:Urea active transporter protein n=1 Tax=Seiridium cardinale TaxID=138064 RepID=A0ABR2X929_9PEZI
MLSSPGISIDAHDEHRFRFGAGCSVPIFTFAVPAIEFKRKAPNAHAFLELVKHRYGASGHVVLGIFPLTYQISIAFNLLVGGVDAFNLVHGNAGDEFPTMRNLYGGHVKLIFLDGGFSATVNSQVTPRFAVLVHYSFLFIDHFWFRRDRARTHTSFVVERRGLSDKTFYKTPALSSCTETKGLCLVIEETVAVTRLVTFDFYRSYIHPEATGKQLILVSHIAAVTFGLIAAAIAVGLVYAGTSVSSIVAAIAIVIDALLAPVELTPLITYIKLENYDFEKFKELKQVDDTAFAIDIKDGHLPIKTAVERTEEELQNYEAMEAEPLSAMNIALGLGLFIAISMTILWPIPMLDSGYIYMGLLWGHHHHIRPALGEQETYIAILPVGVEWPKNVRDDVDRNPITEK